MNLEWAQWQCRGVAVLKRHALDDTCAMMLRVQGLAVEALLASSAEVDPLFLRN